MDGLLLDRCVCTQGNCSIYVSLSDPMRHEPAIGKQQLVIWFAHLSKYNSDDITLR